MPSGRERRRERSPRLWIGGPLPHPPGGPPRRRAAPLLLRGRRPGERGAPGAAPVRGRGEPPRGAQGPRRPPPWPGPRRRRAPPRRHRPYRQWRLACFGSPFWLYFTELGIGTPPRKFRMQVDTGSDLLWVNCVHRKDRPNASDSAEVREYNLSSSLSGRLVTCDQEFCIAEYGEIEGCTHGNLRTYVMQYGDGSRSSGYYVTDYVQYDQVTGDHQFNASIKFGCGAQQSGGLSSLTSPIDGLIGFGPANVSIVSQLASSGKVRKTFAHCFDNVNGGGIFVIGDVLEPKVQTTPLTPNMPHYNVNLRSIEVGGELLQLPSYMFDTGEMKAVIDSGTTLAYLPGASYTPLMDAILSYQPNLTIETQNGFLCFPYVESVDDGFPVVSFHFEKSLSLRVYPHEYLFQNTGDRWCVGWQENEIDRGGINDVILLGDLVLSNKLVIYDLENNAIGWTEYNCSSSIKVQDHKAGEVYSISGHNISSAFRLEIGRLILLFMMYAMLHYMLIHV